MQEGEDALWSPTQTAPSGCSPHIILENAPLQPWRPTTAPAVHKPVNVSWRFSNLQRANQHSNPTSPTWIRCALPTELSIYWGKEKLLKPNIGALTSSTILVTLAPDKPLTSLPYYATLHEVCTAFSFAEEQESLHPWRASKHSWQMKE
jgi:hypothetical protein